MGRPKKIKVEVEDQPLVQSQPLIASHLPSQELASLVKEAASPSKAESSVGTAQLASALVMAINSAKSPEKKTPFTRKKDTPWTPKDGSAKLKLKRQMYQHGVLIDEEKIDNEEVTLLNKLRPGLFMDGSVKVYRRRDRGVDIDYHIKTAAQRLKLVNMFGIRNFKELLERCIFEASQPKKSEFVEDND